MDFDNVCILYDIHNVVDIGIANFENLRRAAEGICHIRVIAQEGAQLGPLSDRAIVLSNSEIFDAFPHKKGRKIIPGNLDLKMIAASKKLTEYSSFIRLEFDAWIIGDQAATISDLADIADRHDFAASRIKAYDPTSNWVWFKTIETPASRPLDQKELLEKIWACFLPVSIYSRRFLEQYEKELIDGWCGHEEVLGATLAYLNGFKVFDLSGTPSSLIQAHNFGVEPLKFITHPSGKIVHPIKRTPDLVSIVSHLADSLLPNHD